ncbi:peroxisomal coenzyme A diphosphatase NUDT7 [Eucyclogobius newberryi]|uniref:peroxisomal coenzyme A diphosphatase NUDT7 n=1 Tax=Eucyclogobius newberryi TaxID=166745 RepID=UPI003B5A5F15
MSIKARAISALRHFDTGDKFAHLPLPKASVLIPLCVRGEELHALMTLRSMELRTNAGEVCFPGGKRDPGDRDDVETALREAQEEIGLQPDQVQVLCTLTPVVNKSGLLVTPVVGFIDEDFRPSPNPAEVSAVFTVPLELFTQEENHALVPVNGLEGPLHCFHYQDVVSNSHYHIWGLTAVLAVLVAVCVLQKKTEFEVGFEFENPLHFFEQNLLKRISKL